MAGPEKKKNVDTYIEGLDGWQADVVSELRLIVRRTVPTAAEKLKWAQPIYEHNGPFCYMKAFKSSVNFGFWRGIEIKDHTGILEGGGEKMRHVKIRSIDDINEKVLADMIIQAYDLNEEKGDPSRG